jgi:hypothetical protein
MQIFDLVFIAAFLTIVAAVVRALVIAVRGNRARARTVMLRLGTFIAAYLAVVAAVGLASPQRVVDLGLAQCSDDWCITPDSVHREVDGRRAIYTIGFRLASRARRVAQREKYVAVYLISADGQRFDPMPDVAAVPFDTLLRAGEVIRASRRFIVPAAARGVGLVVAREGGFGFPGCCIIGDEGSFFHKRTVIRLGSSRDAP